MADSDHGVTGSERGEAGQEHTPQWRPEDDAVRRRIITIGASAVIMVLALITAIGFFVTGSSLRGAGAAPEPTASRTTPLSPTTAPTKRHPVAPPLAKHDAGEIQRRIDEAVDGAVIQVGPGIYEGTLDFRGKRITLTSRDGAATTIIDAAGATGPVVTIGGMADEGLLPRLQGFTVRGAKGPWGTGLHVERASPIVTRCVFEGNAGSGVRLFDSAAVIDECRIIGNSAPLYGGGAAAVGGGPVFVSTEFVDNYTVTGGGALNLRHCAAIVLACTFTGNRVTSGAWGGAIFSDGGELTVCDSTFLRNGSGEEGGAIYVHGGSARIDRCVFEGNAARSAWSVLGQASHVRIRDTRFCGPAAWNVRADSLDEQGNVFAGDCLRDCNGNGVADDVEIAKGLVTDCDGSGVPDACKMDCDGDGLPDVCAIAMGLVADENGNGIPDECEAAMGQGDAPSSGDTPWRREPLPRPAPSRSALPRR